jgi:hypothetical protein
MREKKRDALNFKLLSSSMDNVYIAPKVFFRSFYSTPLIWFNLPLHKILLFYLFMYKLSFHIKFCWLVSNSIIYSRNIIMIFIIILIG